MQGIFMRILSISITAGYLIAAVMILRVLVSKMPKWITCLLWMLVGLRLICPFSIESSFSFIPQGAYTFYEDFGGEGKPESSFPGSKQGLKGQKNNIWSLAAADVEKTAGKGNKNPDFPGGGSYPVNDTDGLTSGISGNGINKEDGRLDRAGGSGVYKADGSVNEEEGSGVHRADGKAGRANDAGGVSGDMIYRTLGSRAGSFVKSNIRILTLVWLLGLALMLSYLLVSYMLIRKKMQAATRLRENIYECEYVDSPFILGVMAPRIFIPYHMEEERLVHVLAHENVHLKRKDHIVKLAAFLILSVYWLNPLVWLSYILLCRDIELACDERVVKSMGEKEKTGYLLALLECSVSRGRANVCPLAFGEIGIKERVIRVKKFKKPPVWLVIIVFIVCVTVSVGFLTSPKRGEESRRSNAVVSFAVGDGILNAEIKTQEKEDGSGDEMEEGQDGQKQGETAAGENNYGNLASSYRMRSSEDGEMSQYTLAALWLGFVGEEKGNFTFVYDILSSYMPAGTYKIEDGKIICTTNDGQYHFVFKIEEDGTLIFMADQSSEVKPINEDFGTTVTDKTVFYPEPDIYDREDVEVKAVDLSSLDFTEDAGADGAQLYYADEKRIIFGGYFGLFVYDRESGRIISSLDLEYINCHYTQGDNYCEILVSKDGKTVYLQPYTVSDGKSHYELYIFDIEENTLQKSHYDGNIGNEPFLDLYRVDYDGYAKAVYMGDGEERVCILYRDGFGVIGDCSFVDYPSDGEGAVQYSPLFKPEGYEKAEEFGAEDIHDIVEIKVYSDGVISEITDADTLKKIEAFLSKAEKTGELVLGEVPGSWPAFNNHPNDGNRFCMFTNPVYIKRSDGVRGIIWPAEDNCRGYISGKGFYQMEKGADRGLWHLISNSATEPEPESGIAY